MPPAEFLSAGIRIPANLQLGTCLIQVSNFEKAGRHKELEAHCEFADFNTQFALLGDLQFKSKKQNKRIGFVCYKPHLK